jgi:hypothetical protein
MIVHIFEHVPMEVGAQWQTRPWLQAPGMPMPQLAGTPSGNICHMCVYHEMPAWGSTIVITPSQPGGPSVGSVHAIACQDIRSEVGWILSLWSRQANLGPLGDRGQRGAAPWGPGPLGMSKHLAALRPASLSVWS